MGGGERDVSGVDRESVPCPFCGAAIGEPCDFPSGEPWIVVENGVERRTVHAARYAKTLPEADVAAFWETAVETYLSTELAALGEQP